MSTSRDDFGIAVRSALLQKGARQKFSLFFLIIIATSIFFLDYYKTKPVNFARVFISDGLYRASSIATAPFLIFSDIKTNIVDLFVTFKENKILKSEIEELKKKNSKLNS